MRSLCYSTAFTSTHGDSPAALGNRIAAAAIAYGKRDGSLEAEHYVDGTYVPENQPLIVQQPGSTVHDATFWQPLALSVKSAQGGGSVPAAVQTFEDAQWGGVRTFAPRVDVKLPRLADPSTRTYRAAALAAVRASREAVPRVDASPTGWNAQLPSLGLARDVHVDLALNAALNDAAVAVWRAKRTSNAPRPISMVRYLAFNGKLPARLDRWRPSAPTPASPGGVSADAAFAASASRVLDALLGRPYSARAAAAARHGVATGTELAGDETLGTRVGDEVARRVLAKLRAG
jgi:hypothetical protein